MSESELPALSRRERQIMEIIYRRGSATAAEVLGDLADPPSYSAVRALLRILEEKGHLAHEVDGPRYVFRPTVPRDAVRGQVLDAMVQTFFDGSAGLAAAALLGRAEDLPREELDELARLIDRARKEGR